MTPQQGAFEVQRAPHCLASTSASLEPNLALLQTARPPVETCYNKPLPLPYAVTGDFRWSDVALGVDFLLASPDDAAAQHQQIADGVLLAVRVQQASCEVKLNTTRGLFLFFYANSSWELYNHISTIPSTIILSIT